MKLQIMGCGTIIPAPPYHNGSGYLLDETILIDCGPGVWHALCKNGKEDMALDCILLSHFHVDHVSDLDAILMTRYLRPDTREQPLRLAGPAGIREWFRKMEQAAGDWIQRLNLTIDVIDEVVEYGRYRIHGAHTGHTENSICYRIEDDQGKILFYSGDTDYQTRLVEMAVGAHLAVIEASNTEDTRIEGHLTPGLAARVAREARVHQLLLTHMYPEVDPSDAVREAAAVFKGTVIPARDGEIIEF